jgi:2-polyprenyl-3-methyl-5-hydroxy-6-metoxy-1,4-benzoquinol methylase
MNSYFLHLLVHPLSKTDLHLENNALQTSDGSGIFKVIKGVPILLPRMEDNAKEAFNYQDHYEKDALAFDYFADWHPVHKEENRRLHQQIVHQIPKEAQAVLDVGCGGAWLAKELIPQGKKVMSMDISTTNPIRAVELVASENHFGLVADVFHLPIQPNSFDCIVASEIIEHVKDPELFLACLFNVLKPGGTLIVTTPFNESIQQSLCIHCNQLTPHNAHIHSFTAEKIKSIAPKLAGKLKTKTFNSKVLVNLQLHLLLKFMPFGMWKLTDGFFHRFMGKRDMRLMLIVKK